MQFTLAKAKTSIRLSDELGRGGEGAVFSVEGQQNRAAKIYEISPDQRKVQKLQAMASSASPELLRIAAWPIDLLTDTKGTVRGFLMPRIIARRDIHELYSPKSRSETFPEADYRFLGHVGANIARAFATVHAQGHVIGDVNHGNLLVGSDGTVMLIDCDSFQITSGAQVFTCDVGVPLFTAPELHGQTFRGLVRSQNHDRFGLAILIFHLLFMGRHPFAGRYSGPGEMPIEKAIAEYRFAYGPDRVAYRMERPPGTVGLETAGADIATNFMQSFNRTGSNGARPDAISWIRALESLKANLCTCKAVTSHQYLRSLPSCPWCAVEMQVGVRLFGQRIIIGGPTGAVDVEVLWRAITMIAGPGPDPALPSQSLSTQPGGPNLLRAVLKGGRTVGSLCIALGGFIACNTYPEDGGVVAALIAYGIAYGIWPRVSAEKRLAAERAYAAAHADWQNILRRWNGEACQTVFSEKLAYFAKARAELTDLPNERQRRMRKLEVQREQQQRQRYLDRFRIDRARIRGVGSGRTAMLASYGIETAADVEPARILQIPGFGQSLTSELLLWRQAHERNFRFNPNDPIDPRDIQSLDRELEARRQALLTSLRQGPDVLRRLVQEILSARSRLMPIVEATWNNFSIAKAHRDGL